MKELIDYKCTAAELSRKEQAHQSWLRRREPGRNRSERSIATGAGFQQVSMVYDPNRPRLYTGTPAREQALRVAWEAPFCLNRLACQVAAA